MKNFDDFLNEEEVGDSEAKSIEIDCPPGSPRPDDLFPGVIAGTGLEEKDFELVSKVFGNFTWNLISKDKTKVFDDSNKIISERLTKLYKAGTVRYASW